MRESQAKIAFQALATRCDISEDLACHSKGPGESQSLYEALTPGFNYKSGDRLGSSQT